jgi:hypothetical protein
MKKYKTVYILVDTVYMCMLVKSVRIFRKINLVI